VSLADGNGSVRLQAAGAFLCWCMPTLILRAQGGGLNRLLSLEMLVFVVTNGAEPASL